MRGGEKFYQNMDNTRKKIAGQKQSKTMNHIYNQCPKNQGN